MSEGPTTRPKDSDLRQAVHAHGARPGTDLWKILVELQRRRDREAEKAQGPTSRGPSGPRSRFASPL